MPSLSASQRAAWLDCRQRWWYEYIGKPDVPAYLGRDLMRGTAGHAAVEAYYSIPPEGRSLEMLLANSERCLVELSADRQLNPREEGDVLKALEDVHQALKHFWHQFGADVDYPLVQTEVRVERPLAQDWSFHAVLDGLIDLPDRAIILENKFPLYAPQAGQYEIWSPQHRDYAWALGLDKPVFVVYNVLSTTRADRRGPLLIPSWQQREALAVNLAVVEDMRLVKVFPTYGFHCQRCPYRELCLTRLAGGNNDSV